MDAGAPAAVAGLAADYDGVDEKVAAELDATMPKTSNERGDYGLSADGEDPGVTVSEPTAPSSYRPTAPSTATPSAARSFTPSLSSSARPGWFKGVDVLIKVLGGPGNALSNVNDSISDLYAVQWESLEKCAKTVQVLSSFSDRVPSLWSALSRWPSPRPTTTTCRCRPTSTGR